MPTKARGKVADLIENQFAVVEPTQEELDLQSFLEDVGPSLSSVDLYRLHKDGRKAYKSRLYFADLKDNALEHIRSTYGEGKWLLSFRDAGGKIKGNKVVEIESELGDSKPPIAAALTQNQPDPHLSFMREQMTMMQNLVMSMIANMGRSPQGPDLGAMMTGIAAMMQATKQSPVDIDKILLALKPPDMTQTLMTMMQAFKPTESGFDVAAKVIGMARDLAPEQRGGGESGAESLWGAVADVGKHFADKFLPPVGTARPSAVVTQHPVVTSESARIEVPSMPSGALPPAENPPSAEGQSDVMMKWIKVGLDYLKEKAKINKDPQIYTDMILDNAEEPQWQSLIYGIQHGAGFEDLLTFDTEIRDNPAIKEWFKKVFDGLLAELNDIGNTGGTGRDVPDVTPHAVPSTDGREPASNPKPRKSTTKPAQP